MKSKKFLAIAILTIIALVSVFALVACEPEVEEHVCKHPCPVCGKCLDNDCDDPVCADKCPGHELPDYDMSGVSFNGKTVIYNGEAQTLTITGTLPEGVTVSYEYYLVGEDGTETKLESAPVEVGTYKVVAKFTGDEDHKPIADKTATLIIDEFGISLTGATVPYDGQPHTLTIEGELREGVTVSYEYYLVEGETETKLEGEAKPVNAGVYKVVAKFASTDPDIVIKDRVANLTITKIDVDMSGLTLSDKTVKQDGAAHTVEIEGTLPAGVTGVTYEYYNGSTKLEAAPTAAGTYKVVAKFTVDGNHKAVSDLEATLTIAEFALLDKTVTYDGTAKTLAITGDLPSGVTVSYEYYLDGTKLESAPVDAGVYNVVAKFTGGSIADQTATLTIEKANLEIVLGSASFVTDLDKEQQLDKELAFTKNDDGSFYLEYDGKEYLIKLVGVTSEFDGLSVDDFKIDFFSDREATKRSTSTIPDVDGSVFVRVTLNNYAKNYTEITKNYNSSFITSVTVNKRIVHITNATELQAIINDVKSPIVKLQMRTKYVLENDIDLQGAVWKTLGAACDNNSFIGEFDGQGHTISNFVINESSIDVAEITNQTGLAFGFWGYLTDANIHNVNFDSILVRVDAAKLKELNPAFDNQGSAANPIVFGVVAGRTRNSFWGMGTIFENITVTNLDVDIKSHGGFYGTFVGEEYAGIGSKFLDGDMNNNAIPGAQNVRNNLDAKNVKIVAGEIDSAAFGRLSIGGIVGELMYSGHIYENCDLENVWLVNGSYLTKDGKYSSRNAQYDRLGWYTNNLGGFIGLDYSTWTISEFNNCTLHNYRLETWVNSRAGIGEYYSGTMRGSNANPNAIGSGVDMNNCTVTNDDNPFYGMFRFNYEDESGNCVPQNGHWVKYVYNAGIDKWNYFTLADGQDISSEEPVWNLVENVAFQEVGEDEVWTKFIYSPETGEWRKEGE